jgi:tetratricopeptide (TPR) repeat protein
VTEVAQRCGFRHFGRFAHQYRDAFGETPSETLRHSRSRAGQQGGGDSLSTRRRKRTRPIVIVRPPDYPIREPYLGTVASAIAEEIAGALCEIGSIQTKFDSVAHDLPRKFNGKDEAVYLLLGSIMPGESDLRIALRLVERATGKLVWSEAIRGRSRSWKPVSRSVVEHLRKNLVGRVIDHEIERAGLTPSLDRDTHGQAMHALGLVFRSRPDATRHALEMLYPCMERDPDDALITALTAWAHAQLVMYNDSSSPAGDRASAIALNRRAAVLDEGNPFALTARSAVHTMSGEFDDAVALVSRALELDPTSGWAWGRAAWLSAYAGSYRRAIVQFRRALRTHAPAGIRANALVGLGTVRFGLGDYTTAAKCLQRAMHENPGMWWANRSLSVSLARIGEHRRARKALDRLRRHSPGLTVDAVIKSVPFEKRFLTQIGEGLDELGLPP